MKIPLLRVFIGFYCILTLMVATLNAADSSGSEAVGAGVQTSSTLQMPADAVELKAVPVPPELIAVNFASIAGQIFPSATQYQGKMPVADEKLIGRLTGVFMSTPQIVFVLYKSSPVIMTQDRMIIDSNANGLLDDEKEIVLTPSTIKSEGLPVKLLVDGKLGDYIFKRDNNSVQLISPSIQGGMIDLFGRKVKIAAFSPDNSYSLENTVLFVDINNNGVFDISRNPFEREYFFSSRLMAINGKFYNLVLAPDGARVALTEYSGFSGKLNLTLPQNKYPDNIEPAKYYFFELLPLGGGSRDILFSFTQKLPLTVPDGQYSLLNAGILTGNMRELLTFAHQDFAVKGNTVIFDVARLQLKIEVGQSPDGNVLKIGQKTSGIGSTIINHVGDMNLDKGPELIISYVDTPEKILLKSNLEYG